MEVPKVFISYSHDSEAHKEWVLRIATDLRRFGIDTLLDQWDLRPGQDLSQFMQRGIQNSDRVVMVCSENYVARADGGTGGVGYERLVVTTEVIASIDTIKFVPIVRGNSSEPKTPSFLGPRLYIDFEDDDKYDNQLEALARDIHGVQSVPKPDVAPNPFASERAVTTAIYIAGNGPGVNEDSWFNDHAERATNGIQNIGLTGHMEFRANIRSEFSKSQIELLSAVKRSNIQHFGWPIAILLENREEFKPRPIETGIVTEVAITDEADSSRISYDYWAAKNSGEFYLLQSLFEDSRSSEKIFFNTRLVRVAESFLFLAKYYKHLGVNEETILDIRFSHENIQGRDLGSSNPRRHVVSRKINANSSTSDLAIPIGAIQPNLVEHVKNVCAPFFMLFDYKEFDDTIYDEIVSGFENGEVK